MGRFPVTVFGQQWLKVFDMADEITPVTPHCYKMSRRSEKWPQPVMCVLEDGELGPTARQGSSNADPNDFCRWRLLSFGTAYHRT